MLLGHVLDKLFLKHGLWLWLSLNLMCRLTPVSACTRLLAWMTTCSGWMESES